MVTPLRRKLYRDLGGHRAQFVAIAITMFLGVAIFAATYDSYRNLRASYATTATEFHFANLSVSGGDVETFASRAGSAAGVADVTLRRVVDVPFRIGDVKLLGRAVEIPVGEQPAVNRLEVVSGAYPATDGTTVLIEQHMADHFGLTAGDTFEVLDGTEWKTVTVGGVAASPEYIWTARNRQELLTTPDNFGVAFVPPSFAAALSPSPNESVVYYTDGTPDDALTATLTAAARDLGATAVTTRAEQASNAALEEDLRGFEEMAVFFPLLFLAAAAMAAYVMISRLVHTQRPHIGVMLANGFSRRQVLTHYLGYGFVPGMLGTVPGVVGGVLLARLITRLYTSLLAIPVTLIQFYPVTILGGLMFGIVASLVAAFAPALVASRVAPAEAMRGETPSGAGRVSMLERLVPPLRRMPVTWRMTLRGIGRNPRRTAYTMIGVVLSLMLVLVSWGMIDTTRHLLDRQFVEIEQEDATVYFVGAAAPAQVQDLATVSGIAAVEPSSIFPASIDHASASYDTSMTVLVDDTTMHRFVAPDGTWFSLPSDGLVLGAATRELLGVAVGDRVTVRVSGIGSIEATVAAFVDEPLGTVSYAARSYAESLLGAPIPPTSAFVSYAPGADPTTIRTAVTDLPSVAAFEDAKALYAVIQNYMVLFYAFVGVMLIFGAAMAFALIFNSMSVNIAERSREVATLLAVGTDRRRISRFITAENLLVALFGIPLGLVVGYFAAREAMASFSSDLFSFNLWVAPTTYVWAAVAILVVALVSQWPGLRAIRRISIPKIVKERSA